LIVEVKNINHLKYFFSDFDVIKTLKKWSILYGLFLLFTTSVFGQQADYAYYREITFDPNKVEGSTDLVNFPVLIEIDSGYEDLKHIGNGGSIRSFNGYDIIFTSENGATILEHDIEGYYGADGRIFMWVKIPVLSATDDTVIRMYYSGPDIDRTSKAFNTDYKGVYHFDGNPLRGKDFSKYNNDLVVSGVGRTTTSTPMDEAGIFDGDGYLDGTSGGELNISRDLTIEAWINVVNTSGALTYLLQRPIVVYSKGDVPLLENENSNAQYNFGVKDGHLYLEHEYAVGFNEYQESTVAIEDSVWHHVAVTRNAASRYE